MAGSGLCLHNERIGKFIGVTLPAGAAWHHTAPVTWRGYHSLLSSVSRAGVVLDITAENQSCAAHLHTAVAIILQLGRGQEPPGWRGQAEGR